MAWNYNNKKYYSELGYKWTNRLDLFLVSCEHLPYGSKKKVDVICDKCHNIYTIEWRDYLKHHSDKYGDLCFKCVSIKREDTCMDKYGEKNPSQVKKFKEKRKETHLKKYGVENAFQSEEIKDKIKLSNIEKYGFPHAAQSEIVQEKFRQTNLDKYGVDNPNKTKEVREKITKTLYENGTCPTSKQQLKVFDSLKEIFKNVYLNYPVGHCNLDCYLEINNCKIDIEYDGEFWHKNRKEQDKRRDYYFVRRGYKILRIKGNNEVPSKEQLINAIDYLVKGNHSYAEIILDI